MHKPADTRELAPAEAPRPTPDAPVWAHPPEKPQLASPTTARARWEATAADWVGKGRHGLWRRISDQIYVQALQPLLTRRTPGRTLKTDLFDEAVSGGIVRELFHSGATVVGVDISALIVAEAAAKHPELLAVVADTRALPFKPGAFDTVVSFSTLDHFEVSSDIDVAIDELGRVVRDGGEALVTLDNALNPIVAFRNWLPPGLRRWLGVPYWVGPTYGPRGLRQAVERSGFRIERARAIVHAPRAIAVVVAGLLDRHLSARAARYLATACHAFESLDRLPTRYLSGCFALVVARRIPRGCKTDVDGR